MLWLLLCGVADAGGPEDEARRFALPAPTAAEGSLQLWSTHYVLHIAAEIPDGLALLDPFDRPFPPGAPVTLTARDWCSAALEGSARITRLDGSVLTVNYAGTGPLAVDCGPPLGHPVWRRQGTVRFGHAAGASGDGVGGYRLVPFRTIATDPDLIPTGSAVYIPSARGVRFRHAGRARVHDGWFFAGDVGGMIRGHQIDTFTGTADSPFPHVGNRRDATFEAWLPGAGPPAAALRALHLDEAQRPPRTR